MKKCFLCGSTQSLELHHIFNSANRTKSEKDGLVVFLCHWCHNEPPYGVHHNQKMMRELKQYGQKRWLQEHPGSTVEDFIKEYGKNYFD